MNQKKCMYKVSLALIFLFWLLLMPTYASTPDALPSVESSTVPAHIENQSEGSDNNVSETSSQNEEEAKLNIVQIITSGGVVATGILGIANLLATNRKIRIDGISNKRTQWIESVRKITASIVCCDLRAIDDKVQFEKEYSELLKNAYMLSLYLNIQGPFDRVVSDYLIQFVKSSHQRSDDFIHNRRMLNFAVQVYLKSEWNRVKCESGLNLLKKYDEKKSITAILEGLTGDYVTELNEKYNSYLKGAKMDAPVFFEYIDISCK